MTKSSSKRPKRTRFCCSACGEPTDAFADTQRLSRQLCRACFGKGKDKRPRELNDLTGREWAAASRSVEQYPDVRSDKQRLHGASFPQSLAEQQIQIFTKKGETVLDPFVGVGTTLDACAALERRGIGVDINPEFIEIARRDVESCPNQELIVGDTRLLTSYVDIESVNFVLTSPPYGALLRNVKSAFPYKWREHSTIAAIPNPDPYSTIAEDLGNLEYADFLVAIRTCLEQTWKVLRPGSYAVWIVKDFRAVKEGIPYVNFHGHLIEQAEAAGFVLWDLRIFDQTKYRPLVCLGFPSRNFYLNIGHSYLVVLRKR